MAKFIHPGEISCSGPVLLDREQLESLDSILKEVLKEYESKDEDEIQKRVRRIADDRGMSEADWESFLAEKREMIKHDRYGFDDRVSMIQFDDGTSVKVESLLESMDDPDIQGKKPTGFISEFRVGSRKFRIVLRNNRDECIKLDVSPNDDETVQRCRMIIANWVDSVRPSTVQSLGCRFGGVLAYIACLIFLLFLAAGAANGCNGKGRVRGVARDLIAQGINDRNMSHAVEIILRQEFSLYDGYADDANRSWPIAVGIAIVVYSILFALGPKLEMAIGRGRRSVERWRIYLRLIQYSFPLFVLGSLFSPLLELIFR